MRRGTLYVKVGGEDIAVAHCTVEISDGGVFVTEETEHGKETMTWRRIGTLSDDICALLGASKSENNDLGRVA